MDERRRLKQAMRAESERVAMECIALMVDETMREVTVLTVDVGEGTECIFVENDSHITDSSCQSGNRSDDDIVTAKEMDVREPSIERDTTPSSRQLIDIHYDDVRITDEPINNVDDVAMQENMDEQ